MATTQQTANTPNPVPNRQPGRHATSQLFRHPKTNNTPTINMPQTIRWLPVAGIPPCQFHPFLPNMPRNIRATPASVPLRNKSHPLMTAKNVAARWKTAGNRFQ